MSFYLSIIASSRNDNHGGDMTRRMRIFVRALIDQCNKFNVPAELIMVEWNPPADKPPLHEVLPQPRPGDKLTLRYITVPNQLHAQYFHSRTIPLFQMIAKNVGIRRAKGEYILCTNIDLLFSDALMAEIAARKLQPGKYYRANRCDVPAGIDEQAPTAAQLAWCEKNVMARQGYDSEHLNLVGANIPWIYRHPLLSRLLNYMAGKIRPWYHPERFRIAKIDYMACGDFTMMSKSDWMKIDGYVEMDLYSIHVDSMCLNACVAQGIEQVLYPPQMCTYHMHHEEGWASMDPLQMLRFLEKRPGMDWGVMQAAGEYLIKHKTNYNINKPNWGFADIALQETVFNPQF